MMKINVKPATLIKRYKRFLADIILANTDEETTIHVANTGAMSGCAEPNDTVWYSTSDNPKRKYPFSWEITQTKHQHFICVNTLRANTLVEQAITAGLIPTLTGFSTLQREVKYGNENSKIDILLTYLDSELNSALNSGIKVRTNTEPTDKKLTYIEVKSVTLLDENIGSKHKGQGFFPDAVTLRGQKHLRELILLVQQGHRAILFFAVLHSGIKTVEAAQHIDPVYAALLKKAKDAGVEIIAYQADFSLAPLVLNNPLSNQEISIKLKKAVPVKI